MTEKGLTQTTDTQEARKQESQKAPKRAADSHVEQIYAVRPASINGYGRLFGGQLMQWIDETAGFVSRRHCGTIVTTAAVDTLNFIAPAYANEIVVVAGSVTYVGHTSMEVRVDTYVEEMDGERRRINTAFLVMVSIDDHGNGLPVPGLILETEEQKAEWEAGRKRYELRKQRRKEGF